MSQESQDQTANPAEAAAAEPVTPATETAPSAEQLLQAAETKAQEHQDAFLRAKAETENVRKRAITDVANAHKYAVENFATELLAVKDSLEAALAVETATIESLKSGAELTLKQLSAAFEKFKLVEVSPVGQKFDPHRHQAISLIEADAEPNTVEIGRAHV